MIKTVNYAELHCLSNFSFLRGASHPGELVQRAVELGYQALALTDECSVAGVVRAYEAAREQPLKLIIGSEFHLADELVVVLAPDRRAYAQLCTLISHCRRKAEKGHYHIQWSDFDCNDGLNLDHCLLLYRPAPNPEPMLPDPMLKARNRLKWLAAQFPQRCWLLVERLLTAADEHHYRQCITLASELKQPVVCANNVHMHHPKRQKLQDLLTAIHHRTTIKNCGFKLAANGERHLRSINKINRLYQQALIDETLKIANRCHFCLSELRYEYPAELVPAGLSARQHLHNLVKEGARLRFPDGIAKQFQQQISKELKLIGELKYEHYFLTIQDIVKFARRRDILCQGRGSSANSIVCYCLHITEVDPKEVNLLIERFISKERDEPPDIDVDFEHERREEVIQYIYQRYGRDRAGLTATVISYRAKSAIRDVGKALGMDESYLSWLISQLDRRSGRQSWLKQLSELGGETPDPTHRLLTELVMEILDFPRHLSQHVGGFIISAGPLTELVPIENAAMTERTIIQWNKDDLETLGLLKMDVLALGMLTAIRKTLEMLSQSQGKPFSIQDIPRKDPLTYEMLCQADSVGVFQVESRAQMSMLPRLKPQTYYDLVIQVAIVRPGPIQGDMVHPFLRRRDGIEQVDYPSPEVQGVLERTLGVPIFQEQVIKLAMVAAGFSGGEADQLRRAMAAWKRNGHIHKYQQKLITGMLERGYEKEFAERICRQIEGFGEYGFPESHAASFALLVYVSAWLKCHHPAAFCCGLLNSLPMGFYTPAQLIQDVRRHGIEVRPVDINRSRWDSSLEYDVPDTVEYGIPDKQNRPSSSQHTLRPGNLPQPAMRLGFRLIKGLSKDAAELILQNRPETGFRSITDARLCCHLKRNDWDALAASGSLNNLSDHRYQARWELLQDLNNLELTAVDTSTAPNTHSAASNTQLSAPSEQADLEEDFRHLGLSLGRHPLELLREQQLLQGCLRAHELLHCRHGQLVHVAGLVTNRQRPGTSTGVTFVTLEDETGQINLVVWKATAQIQRKALLTANILKVSGVMEREGSVIHVIAGRLTDISDHWNAMKVKSRDFR
ncbi:error-prone DNA polymerase [Motiliproteus sp. MSK22-1]|nr:error-prone DNA polymerase [Motiliproteus sp. MSK22-1]